MPTLAKIFLTVFLLSAGLVLFSYGWSNTEGQVVINETAWMGTASNANAEWIELYNSGSESVDLTGWKLEAEDGAPSIDISAKAVQTPPVIEPDGYFLLERTSDATVADAVADGIYTGALGNEGEVLILKDAAGLEVYRADGADSWKINGADSPSGNNETKETAQRMDSGWITASGTPGAENATEDSGSTQQHEDDEGDEEEETASTTPSIPSSPSSSATLVAVAGNDVMTEQGHSITLDASRSRGGTMFTWYLGDGTQKAGKRISHTYQFPGTYVVTLEAKDGGRIATDNLRAFVFGGKAIVSEFFAGASKEKSWIELSNSSEVSIDLGGWILEGGGERFIFSPYTRLSPGTYLVLSSATTDIVPRRNSTIRVRFPNGALADEVAVSEIRENTSASRSGDQFFWTEEPTPGSVNVVVADGEADYGGAVPIVSVKDPENQPADNLINSSSATFGTSEKNVQQEDQAEGAEPYGATVGFVSRNMNVWKWAGLTLFVAAVVSVLYITVARARAQK